MYDEPQRDSWGRLVKEIGRSTVSTEDNVENRHGREGDIRCNKRPKKEPKADQKHRSTVMALKLSLAPLQKRS